MFVFCFFSREKVVAAICNRMTGLQTHSDYTVASATAYAVHLNYCISFPSTPVINPNHFNWVREELLIWSSAQHHSQRDVSCLIMKAEETWLVTVIRATWESQWAEHPLGIAGAGCSHKRCRARTHFFIVSVFTLIFLPLSCAHVSDLWSEHCIVSKQTQTQNHSSNMTTLNCILVGSNCAAIEFNCQL